MGNLGQDGRAYNDSYSGEQTNYIAYPMGGLGAGMICLDGTGSLSHVSVRNRPEIFNQPYVFSALCVKGDPNVARVLEARVPSWKLFGLPGTGGGLKGRNFGLPRFSSASFAARFPFAAINLDDESVDVQVDITGWSPFIPGDADSSSLPMASIEYRFKNPTSRSIETVYSFNSVNFMADGLGNDCIRSVSNGFILQQSGTHEEPWRRGSFCAKVDRDEAQVNYAWFRGTGFDSGRFAWRDVEEGACYSRTPVTEGDPSPGATIFVPITLRPGASETVRLMLCWYVPESDLSYGIGDDSTFNSSYRPWYSSRFTDIEEVAQFWHDNYRDLRRRTETFTDCFYDTTLPAEVVEAVAANLSILKSPTILRQPNGRIWNYEGCSDDAGCCPGSCTHVWNYAQAIPHLFPDLERGLRETEFIDSQNEQGHQVFRSALPIGPSDHDEILAAADGQLGGIIKVFRDWRISGETDWLRSLWPSVRLSLDYSIATWDPDGTGVLSAPHHNTYDIQFWGADGMCTSIYLGALRAAVLMGHFLGEDVSRYEALFESGRTYCERELFDGNYFCQQTRWKDLHSKGPVDFRNFEPASKSSDLIELVLVEGPKYQYGPGCLSDGVIGEWMALVSGVGQVLDQHKVSSHLRSVFEYNFKSDLSEHANPQRPGYAIGNEGGLLLCTWPKGGRPSLPFYFSDEVWTGIEYQVASHLMMTGMVNEGLQIVQAARARYDGRIRNPFDEYECGHWYARALSSYALLQGMTGVRYDAVEKTLYVIPSFKGDFRVFISTATGFGTVTVTDDEPSVEVKMGSIEIERMIHQPRTT